MTIGFEKSFGYLFKDPDWVTKLLIGCFFLLLSFTLIGIPFFTGYMIRIVQWRLNGKEGLPNWDNLGDLFVNGVKEMCIRLVYSVPVMITVGLLLIFSILSEKSDVVSILLLFFMLPIELLMFLYSIFLLCVQPLISYTVASGAPLSQAFQLKKLFQIIKQDSTNTILALVFIWLVGSLSGLGIFFFIIGIIPAVVYSTYVMGDIHGKLLAGWKTRGLFH